MVKSVSNTQLMRKPKIFLAGDGPVPTGFARVIEGIFSPLVDAFDIHHLAISYQGDPHHLPWTVYPVLKRGDDVWGIHRIADLTRRITPDVIFMINDVWVISQWLAALGDVEALPPLIAYIPIDAGPVKKNWIVNFDKLDHIVVYNNYAKSEMLRGLEQHRELNPEFEPPEVRVIPHGIDTTIFRPIAANHRAAARARIFLENPELQEAFIVLNANRNQPRKRIDLTIMGFALFAHDKPDNVKLFLHMGSRDLGWDIPALVKLYDIEERVLMSTAEPNMPFVSQEHLNLVYNACDVGVNTSQAEGWGLVSHEHAATKAAQIVPNHTACADIWGEAAIKLEPALTGIEPATSTEVKYIAPQSLANALEKLYSESNYLAVMSERAYNWATHPDFCWTSISARWRDLIQISLMID